jgi:DNA repair protein RadC
MHEGHRERMREKLLNSKVPLPPHEMLEMLLFYAIPRCNTNEIAHLLIDRFGSLSNVFAADINQLMQIKGIGYNAAFLIKFIPTLFKSYIWNGSIEGTKIDRVSLVNKYVTTFFYGCQVEEIHAVYLDSKMKIVHHEELGVGSPNSVRLEKSTFYKRCFEYPTAAVILCHNHPNENVTPSVQDIELTYEVQSYLANVDIFLIDHFIVSQNEVVPILKQRKLFTQQGFCSNFMTQDKLDFFYTH